LILTKRDTSKITQAARGIGWPLLQICLQFSRML